jgi:hypothetical protein
VSVSDFGIDHPCLMKVFWPSKTTKSALKTDLAKATMNQNRARRVWELDDRVNQMALQLAQ